MAKLAINQGIEVSHGGVSGFLCLGWVCFCLVTAHWFIYPPLDNYKALCISQMCGCTLFSSVNHGAMLCSLSGGFSYRSGN